MGVKYFVARAFRYKESKNWEYKVVGMYDDLSSAKANFHGTMSAMIKDTNDFAMAILYDSMGNVYATDNDDTSVTPEPNEGE